MCLKEETEKHGSTMTMITIISGGSRITGGNRYKKNRYGLPPSHTFYISECNIRS